MRRRHIGQTAAVHSESGLRQTSLVLFSLLLAPNRCRDQPQKRPVVQLHGITLSFHREMADASRKLVGPDVTAAVSFESYPRFIKVGFQDYECLGIKSSTDNSTQRAGPLFYSSTRSNTTTLRSLSAPIIFLVGGLTPERTMLIDDGVTPFSFAHSCWLPARFTSERSKRTTSF